MKNWFQWIHCLSNSLLLSEKGVRLEKGEGQSRGGEGQGGESTNHATLSPYWAFPCITTLSPDDTLYSLLRWSCNPHSIHCCCTSYSSHFIQLTHNLLHLKLFINELHFTAKLWSSSAHFAKSVRASSLIKSNSKSCNSLLCGFFVQSRAFFQPFQTCNYFHF